MSVYGRPVARMQASCSPEIAGRGMGAGGLLRCGQGLNLLMCLGLDVVCGAAPLGILNLKLLLAIADVEVALSRGKVGMHR